MIIIESERDLHQIAHIWNKILARITKKQIHNLGISYLTSVIFAYPSRAISLMYGYPMSDKVAALFVLKKRVPDAGTQVFYWFFSETFSIDFWYNKIRFYVHMPWAIVSNNKHVLRKFRLESMFNFDHFYPQLLNIFSCIVKYRPHCKSLIIVIW